MLELADLRGQTFLDAGCGSGLFSLAAARLGAERIHSFDYDPDSVAATKSLRARFGGSAAWSVEQGDVMNEAYVQSLGEWSVVYSWGVLHHTGALWKAMEYATGLVAGGGALFIAIYNDQGRKSRRWREVKKLYNRLPTQVRTPYAVTVMIPTEARSVAGALVRGDIATYVKGWTGSRERGMSRWHDLLDWVGGYPFEVAKPEEVLDFCRERGFELTKLITAGGGLGCNQFVFRRRQTDFTAR
jgi:SAM-dependent methyltransferase